MSDERERDTADSAEAATTSDDAAGSSGLAGSSRPSGKRSGARSRSAAATIESDPETAGSSAEKPKKSGGGKKPKKTKQSGQGNLLKRVIKYLREVVAELKKVIWPNKQQMITYTIVVVIFMAFIVALVAGLDIGFAKGVMWLFG
ncbi:preprotein translocase subunit SecE [Rhodococcus sp. D2-41]|uniref:Protein translocase subunit SecE n=1 Tax=Speluncibacter jeojiensis TaxID=2710754 RepID=A0A9X4RFC7_9ACTN|nr:preprotein translocase subunit SecE [Rhodococcus sp. D2-41]MDG3009180.1 preprotein translocase subunit SecE [Rhodococcus sp. D2-41]MDG3016147.1 preprotein translocase subunit SecE [Corynebacteriales bacterium D3-21]